MVFTKRTDQTDPQRGQTTVLLNWILRPQFLHCNPLQLLIPAVFILIGL